MKDGRKMMNQCNRINIMKDVAHKLSACSDVPLSHPSLSYSLSSLPLLLLPPSFSGAPPASQDSYSAHYPVRNLLALFAGLVRCTGSANCHARSSRQVCTVAGAGTGSCAVTACSCPIRGVLDALMS